MKFKKQLIKLGACQAAVNWVGNKSLEVAWATCMQGSWMCWLHYKLGGNYSLREAALEKARRIGIEDNLCNYPEVVANSMREFVTVSSIRDLLLYPHE